jgi:hypothetical protein
LKQKKNAQSKKDPRRFRTYSFVLTLLIIALIIGGAYYQTLPKVEHMPDTFVFTSQDWMAYVPSNIQYVGFVNYRAAYFLTGNSSLFGSKVLFEFPQIGFQVLPFDVSSEVDVELPQPPYSGSVTVLQLTAAKESNLVQALASANPTQIASPITYLGHTIYPLLMRRIGDNSSTPGYMTIVNSRIIFSNDKAASLRNVQAIVEQIVSDSPSLFDNPTIRRAVYATGVTDQDYIGLFVGLFPTQMNDTKMVAKSVVWEGDSLTVSRAFLFPSSDIALVRLDQAHKLYRNADSYRILDPWLVVTYNYPLTRLEGELIGI